jgi:hypothetical protein
MSSQLHESTANPIGGSINDDEGDTRVVSPAAKTPNLNVKDSSSASSLDGQFKSDRLTEAERSLVPSDSAGNIQKKAPTVTMEVALDTFLKGG